MTEEELDFLALELKKHSKNIKIISKELYEDYQYLVGVFNTTFFLFGVSTDVDYKETQFFVETRDTTFKEFIKLVNILSEILGEKPADFSEMNDNQFIYLWPNVNQKEEFKRAREFKKAMTRSVLKPDFYNKEQTTH